MKKLTVLFLVRDDQVLLAMKKRGFGVGRWNGVGGKVEPNETVEQALVRECQEEIGVTPTVYNKAAEITFHENTGEDREQLHVHVYLGTAWEGEPTESEEMAPQWFAQQTLPFEKMWADDPFWLPQVLAGQSLRASFTLDDSDRVIEHQVEEVATYGA